jgi:hypothetical protein
MSVSIADGLSRALKPRRIVTHPNAAAVAMHATVIDRRRVRFLMRSSFLRACAHLKWNVHFTHWLVDFARL